MFAHEFGWTPSQIRDLTEFQFDFFSNWIRWFYEKVNK